MVRGLLLSQCSPVISGAALPALIAAPLFGQIIQVAAATPIMNHSVTALIITIL